MTTSTGGARALEGHLTAVIGQVAGTLLCSGREPASPPSESNGPKSARISHRATWRVVEHCELTGAASRVWHIAVTTGDQVNVSVSNSLSDSLTAVHANVEAAYPSLTATPLPSQRPSGGHECEKPSLSQPGDGVFIGRDGPNEL